MEQETQKPNFWAIIPATVRYDDVIGSTAKLLFAEITSLSNQEGYCWASNNYFASLFKISITQVSRLVSSLEDRGFIKTFVDSSAGNQRKIYPQITTESVVKENITGKSFEKKFDDLIGVVATELLDERKMFIEYWTAKNDGGKKEHWQKQKTFSMRQRWATWIRNKRDWTKPKFEKLPSDEELRKKAKQEADRKAREEAEKKRLDEMSKPRTPEEQERIDKRLAEMRAGLKNKFSMPKA